jgi:hypothetical protein
MFSRMYFRFIRGWQISMYLSLVFVTYSLFQYAFIVALGALGGFLLYKSVGSVGGKVCTATLLSIPTLLRIHYLPLSNQLFRNVTQAREEPPPLLMLMSGCKELMPSTEVDLRSEPSTRVLRVPRNRLNFILF